MIVQEVNNLRSKPFLYTLGFINLDVFQPIGLAESYKFVLITLESYFILFLKALSLN